MPLRFPCAKLGASLIGSAALLAGAAVPADASLRVLRPAPADPVTWAGHGGVSTDGSGPTGSLQAVVPEGATVKHAWLHASSGGASWPATVSFGGGTAELADVGDPVVTSPDDEFSYGFGTGRADVTETVAAAGTGRLDFPVSGSGYHGFSLTVVYELASEPFRSIVVLDGTAATSGDTTSFALAEPLVKGESFSATLALGIGFSYQGARGSHACGGGQASTVDVNATRLTSCAGGSDDEASSGLLTVGGVDDATDNPPPQQLTGGTDDELYDLAPFLDAGDTGLTIDTANPSGDDNVFLAVVALTARASAGSPGDAPPPLDTSPTASPQTTEGVGTAPQAVTLTAPDGGSAWMRNADGERVSSWTVPGQGTYTHDAEAGKLTFTPLLGFWGDATPITWGITDDQDRSASSTWTPTVTRPAAPEVGPLTSTGTGRDEQHTTVAKPSGGRVELLDADDRPVSTVVVPGEGTYVLDPETGVVAFVAALGFKGDAHGVRYRVVDAYDQAVEATYAPVVAAPAAPVAEPVATEGASDTPQLGKVDVPLGGRLALLDEAGVEVTQWRVAGEGAYVLDPDAATISFVPEAGFTGTPRAARFRVVDAYGQSSEATFQPVVAARAATPKIEQPAADAPAPKVPATCTSRRGTKLHWSGPRGVKLRTVRVLVDGEVVRTLKGSARSATVSLVGRPKGTSKVVVQARTTTGRIIRNTRTYRLCVGTKQLGGTPSLQLR